jgi:hypothetical protein
MIAGPLMSPTMVLNRGVLTVPLFLSRFTNVMSCLKLKLP